MSARPNFLLLFPDQWRGDCLGALGHPAVETPYLDELAHQSVVFTGAYSACPTCIASRASLATGQTPSTCGRIGYQDGVPWRYEQTMMRCLRDGGYQTLLAGLSHFYPRRAALGFEEMRSYDCALYSYALGDDSRSDYHVWLDRATDGRVQDTVEEFNANAWVVHPWRHAEDLHPNTWTVDAARELLTRRDPLRPFFLQVGFHRPHPPLDPPQHVYDVYADKDLPPVPVGDWAGEFDIPVTATVTGRGHLDDHLLDRARRAYFAQMTHIDSQIGRLLFWMEMKGLLDNTWIVFLSDHGESLGDHHMFHKHVPMEGSAKIPFIVRPPKAADYAHGARCDQPISHMDVMPTFLEAAGVAVPDGVEGSSLAPLVQGDAAGWREFVHGEHTLPDATWQFVTDGKEKYAWEGVADREWFFNLAQDPQELVNRAADPAYAERIAPWRQRLIDVLAKRPQDGLSDGTRLIPGRILPPVRPELLE